MKKLILTAGIAALFMGTSLMAVDHSDVEEVLGLMSINADGEPNMCLGYGKGLIEVGGPGNLTLDYSHKGHRLTTTCTLPAPETYQHDQDLSGKRYLCLLAREGDGKDHFKYTIKTSWKLHEGGIIMTCKFDSFKPFPHADD